MVFGYGKCEHRWWWPWHVARGELVVHEWVLGLFETYMSGYLSLFETCVTEFVQIWVSLLLFWVYEFYLLEVSLLIEKIGRAHV